MLFKFFIILSALVYICCLSYRLGYKQAQIKYLQENIKHEQNTTIKKSLIYSRPNASRSELLSLFNSNTM